MPTVLGNQFDRRYKKQPSGMSREDYELWKLYEPGISNSCEAIYFNVYLGDGKDPGENVEEKWREFWTKKTQLRADSVIVFPDKVKVVEFRNQATANVIGRLLAYMHLLRADNPFGRPVLGEVVTNIYSSIVEDLCEAQKIEYTVI